MLICDVNGLEIGKGDTVAPLTGDFRGKVSAVKAEDGEGFVCVRPSHRPYSKGVWYAAEHVQRLQVAKPPPEKDEAAEKAAQAAKDKKSKASKKPAAKGGRRAR